MNDRGEAPASLVDGFPRQTELLSRLTRVCSSLAVHLDLELLTQCLADCATQLAEAQMGGFVLLGEDGKDVESFKISGWPHKPDGFPRTVCIHSISCRQGVSLRLNDALSHPLAIGRPPNHPQVGPFLSVPLVRNSDTLGAVFVGNEPGGPTFGPDEESLLVAFSAQAAMAVENARRYAQAERLARLRERQRIAQSLHDTLAQMLFTIGLEAEWCVENLGPDGEGHRRIEIIRRLAGRSGDELRSAIFALRSRYVPGDDGLVELLQEQVAEFEAHSGIAATLIVPTRFRSLPRLVSEAVYRIVRESLSNVHKHAQASAVVVSLHRDHDSVTVTIQDNGIGLAEPQSLEADDRDLHFGVVTMRQVAAQVQGDVRIGNNDDLGVIVKARFPVAGAYK